MAIDTSKIPTKIVTLDDENLAKLKGLKGGLVLLEALSQVSVVIEFDAPKMAAKFFKLFTDERGTSP